MASKESKRRIQQRMEEASAELLNPNTSEGGQRWGELFAGIESADDGLGEYKTDPQAGFANLSIRGTSTTNYKRPRTVAAGYDPNTRIMTVVFRDNVWWNYYDVPADMWREFEMAESKGRYLRESGLDTWHNMGPFSLDSLKPSQASLLNLVARESESAQTKNKGEQQGMFGVGAQFDEI